jgi:hypothetical protein
MQIFQSPDRKAMAVERVALAVSVSGQTTPLADMVKARRVPLGRAVAAKLAPMVRQELCVSGNIHND